MEYPNEYANESPGRRLQVATIGILTTSPSAALPMGVDMMESAPPRSEGAFVVDAVEMKVVIYNAVCVEGDMGQTTQRPSPGQPLVVRSACTWDPTTGKFGVLVVETPKHNVGTASLNPHSGGGDSTLDTSGDAQSCGSAGTNAMEESPMRSPGDISPECALCGIQSSAEELPQCSLCYRMFCRDHWYAWPKILNHLDECERCAAAASPYTINYNFN